jgi:Flp pilus assembly protein TadB
MIASLRSSKADLEICGLAQQQLAKQQVLWVSGTFLSSIFLILSLYAVGIPLGGLGSFIVLATGVGSGISVPLRLVRSRATRRRMEFGISFSAFLGLVNVMLAGGAGIETALVAASRAGDDWVFHELEHVLATARNTRQSPWVLLSELGIRLDVPEAIEVSASLQLAGEQGSRIRASLATKASTIQMRQLALAEASAQSATEQMGVPTVLLFVGFIVLLGYPALSAVVGTW